ncbi:MAG: flavin reductase family protein [Chloroflexota bacterium]|nr:flavin reductase family protein [Chloroflexota bacterium]
MEYRDIAPMMGRLWAPLAAVTTHWQGRVNAQIAVAISAASIVPQRPRVLVQIYKGNYSHLLITQSGVFALNFITPEQLHMIRDFGLVSGVDRDKLAGVEHSVGATGAPLLAGCMGYLECQVINAMDGGDMTCFLADVVSGASVPDALPISWREARRLIPQEWNDAWDARISEEIETSLKNMDQIDYSPWTPSPGKQGVPGD